MPIDLTPAIEKAREEGRAARDGFVKSLTQAEARERYGQNWIDPFSEQRDRIFLDAALRSLAESLKEAGAKVVGPKKPVDFADCASGAEARYASAVDQWNAFFATTPCLLQQAMGGTDAE